MIRKYQKIFDKVLKELKLQIRIKKEILCKYCGYIDCYCCDNCGENCICSESEEESETYFYSCSYFPDI